MKKLYYIVAVATLGFISCEKEIEVAENESNDVFTLKASIEALSTSTKATINESYQFLWSDGDQIGVYVNGWVANSNQSFTLTDGAGSRSGSFRRSSDDWFKTDQAQAAFFPWNSANYTTVNTETDNNVSGSTMYFKLKEGYDNYESGQMLTPLVAPMSYSGGYAPITFKHAGAAVKVVINNLPAGAHSMGIEATDQQIRGDYLTDFNASANLALDGEANLSENDVWLNFTATNSERPFTFIFPIPSLVADSHLTFKIYDKNDVLVWSRTATQATAINKGQILEMPALDITPYRQFTEVSAWTVCGDPNDWGDTQMVTNGTHHIAKGITFTSGQKFKIRTGGNWDTNYGGTFSSLGNEFIAVSNGSDIYPGEGTFDIIFNSATEKIRIVNTDECPYPASAHHYSSIKNATELGTIETANCYVITAPGSYKIPVVKGNSSTSAGTVGGAELLWETYNNATSVTPNSVIAAVDWDERETGYIFFKTPDVLLPGNALIAAKDDSDNIIWSWHIWIPATALTDKGEYTVSSKYIMDRNLGAIVASEDVAEGAIDVRSTGLHYQWGRKDPFVGYKWGSPRVDIKVSGASGSSKINSGTKLTVEESIAAPTTFITSDGTTGNGNWLSTNDNTLWGDGAAKTIYDPCPAGYRVPVYDDSDALWKQVNGLDNFSGNISAHWWKLGSVVFPIAGYYYYNGNIDGENSKCYFWSATPHATADYALPQYVYDNSGSWASQPTWGLRKSCGAPVRCVKISGEVLPPIPAGANGVTLATDGSISTDWASAETIAEASGPIKEWKYGFDASNLYFYFKISRSAIIAAASEPYSYDSRRYIYIALDTDNDPSDAEKPDYGDLKITGCEAIALVYPFRGNALTASGTDGTLTIVNGVDENGWTRSPITGSRTGKHLTAYGNVTADYVYVEMSLPRDGIGSPDNGIYRVQFSLSSSLTSIARIQTTTTP